MSEPAPSFQPQPFGRYYLVDKVAVGGMAEVFKARAFSDGGFQKLLVIKRILNHLSGNDDFVKMFIDEAKISVELQHPNIVQIYDFGKIRENYFIAMECVEGKDAKGLLRKLAERRKLLPIEFAVYIVHEMCKGLDFAHKKQTLQGAAMGIVHRDISPSNILLSYDGEVKIADFGIAKAEGSLYDTKDGVLKGKFEYMSPEQASGGDVTAQSDVFACGILLHELLTGRRLFKTDSDLKTLEKVKAVDVPTPSSLNPGIPARLDAIVARALARSTADRYPDARAMQGDLLEFLSPITVDEARDGLRRFLHELFSEEMAAERERLVDGSQKAAVLWEQAPELDLDEDDRAADSAVTLQTPPPPPARAARWPFVLALVAALVAGGAVAFSLLREPETRVVEVEKTVAPTQSAVLVQVEPAGVAARLLLDGVEVAAGAGRIAKDGLSPRDSARLRVEAPGFQPFEDDVELRAGERSRLKVSLVKEAPAKAEPAKAEPAKVEPAKAEPAKVEPPPERKPDPPKVEVAKADPPPERKPEPAAPGKVTVQVKDGWGDVYIDGRKVDTTPLMNHPLPAGEHTVRVVNPATGLDASRTVTVVAGQAAKVTF